MAFTVPTPADVKAAYPEFAGVADPAVQEALDKGGLVIDQAWPAAAGPLAFKLYAAHVLRMGGYGTSADTSGILDQGNAAVASRKAGDHEVKFFNTASGAAAGSAAWYNGTGYGREFRMMQRRYFGGPRVY